MNQPNEEQQPSRALTLQEILANALKSTHTHQEAKAGLETKTCARCGAARPADTALRYCDYCSNPFY
ncbi:MAG: hypothetical protein J7578_15525 [Chitinophagaceae bacterium]|nr:hypothetical protein [Chitinophagaceae bacterium]